MDSNLAHRLIIAHRRRGIVAPQRVMLRITLRDLQYRARRFGLGIAATALVFATTLLLAGVYESFRTEAERAVDVFHADRWVVPAGVAGPFTAQAPLDEAARARVARAPGVRSAESVIVFRSVIRDLGGEKLLNMIAAGPGGLVRPQVTAGRVPARSGEALADDRVEVGVGDTIQLGAGRLRIVGLTHDLTYLAGTPAVLLTLQDGQRAAYGGARLASAVITRGVPRSDLPGLRVMSPGEVVDDLRRPTRSATITVGFEALLMVFIAAGIVGLMTYLSGLDRIVDFAVFKATGVSTRRLLAGMVLEALIFALLAAAVASVLAHLMQGGFPIGVRLTAELHAILFGLALVVGAVVSTVSVRPAVRVDPALAFGRN
jgi:putative ABC transport system permease protein